ncbi:hypothetical protein CEXT_53821, partial [Caerostris extrusa]
TRSHSFISAFSAIGILYFSDRIKGGNLITFNDAKLGIHASVTFHTARAVGEIEVRNITAIFIFEAKPISTDRQVYRFALLASSSCPSGNSIRDRGCLSVTKKEKEKERHE